MIKKMISAFTLSCFLVSFVLGEAVLAFAGSTNEHPVKSEALNLTGEGRLIPQAYGKVTELWLPGSGIDARAKNAPFVINLQTLHCHPEVQRNISSILGVLENRYGVRKIYVEGACGPVDTSWLCGADNAGKKQRIIDSLLERGRLTGAEYYAAVSNRPDALKGLEDRAEYEGNIARLGRILEKRPEYAKLLKDMKNELDYLQALHFNPENKAFNALIEDRFAGKVSSHKFYWKLGNYAARINAGLDSGSAVFPVSMDRYPHMKLYIEQLKASKKINYRLVSRQIGALVRLLKARMPYADYAALLEITGNFSKTGELYEFLGEAAERPDIKTLVDKNFRELKRFLEYQENNLKLDPMALLNEERRLVGEIRMGLSADSGELEVSFLSDFFRYFSDYVNAVLAYDDYEYFKSKFGRFRELWSKYAFKDSLSVYANDFEYIGEYYRTNCDRNRIFIGNMPELSSAYSLRPEENRITDQGSYDWNAMLNKYDVVVVVSGGFHTQGLGKLLKAMNVPHISITPSVTKDIKYSSRLYEELAKLQAGLVGGNAVTGPSEDRPLMTGAGAASIELQLMSQGNIKSVDADSQGRMTICFADGNKMILGPDMASELAKEEVLDKIKTGLKGLSIPAAASEALKKSVRTVEIIMDSIRIEGVMSEIYTLYVGTLYAFAQNNGFAGAFGGAGLTYDLSKLYAQGVVEIDGMDMKTIARFREGIQSAVYQRFVNREELRKSAGSGKPLSLVFGSSKAEKTALAFGLFQNENSKGEPLVRGKLLVILDRLAEAGFIRPYWREKEEVTVEFTALQLGMGSAAGLIAGGIYSLIAGAGVQGFLTVAAGGFFVGVLVGFLHLVWHGIPSVIFLIANSQNKDFKEGSLRHKWQRLIVVAAAPVMHLISAAISVGFITLLYGTISGYGIVFLTIFAFFNLGEALSNINFSDGPTMLEIWETILAERDKAKRGNTALSKEEQEIEKQNLIDYNSMGIALDQSIESRDDRSMFQAHVGAAIVGRNGVIKGKAWNLGGNQLHAEHFAVINAIEKELRGLAFDSVENAELKARITGIIKELRAMSENYTGEEDLRILHIRAASGLSWCVAEMNKALRRDIFDGYTLYVTMESCNKCPQLISGTGIKRVVFGAASANPLNHGGAILKQAGIEVVTGIREKECRKASWFYMLAAKHFPVIYSSLQEGGRSRVKSQTSTGNESMSAPSLGKGTEWKFDPLVHDSATTPAVRLSDEEMLEYFGVEYYEKAKASGKEFYLKPLSAFADGAYLEEWRKDKKNDTGWSKKWGKYTRQHGYDGIYSELPHFSLSEQGNIGLISAQQGREKLEGFIGYKYDDDKRTGKKLLYLRSIELYYKNINGKEAGIKAEVPNVADILFDFLLKNFSETVNQDGSYSAISIHPSSRGGASFAARKGFEDDGTRYLKIDLPKIERKYEQAGLSTKFNGRIAGEQKGPTAFGITAERWRIMLRSLLLEVASRLDGFMDPKEDLTRVSLAVMQLLMTKLPDESGPAIEGYEAQEKALSEAAGIPVQTVRGYTDMGIMSIREKVWGYAASETDETGNIVKIIVSEGFWRRYSGLNEQKAIVKHEIYENMIWNRKSDSNYLNTEEKQALKQRQKHFEEYLISMTDISPVRVIKDRMLFVDRYHNFVKQKAVEADSGEDRAGPENYYKVEAGLLKDMELSFLDIDLQTLNPSLDPPLINDIASIISRAFPGIAGIDKLSSLTRTIADKLINAYKHNVKEEPGQEKRFWSPGARQALELGVPEELIRVGENDKYIAMNLPIGLEIETRKDYLKIPKKFRFVAENPWEAESSTEPSWSYKTQLLIKGRMVKTTEEPGKDVADENSLREDDINSVQVNIGMPLETLPFEREELEADAQHLMFAVALAWVSEKRIHTKKTDKIAKLTSLNVKDLKVPAPDGSARLRRYKRLEYGLADIYNLDKIAPVLQFISYVINNHHAGQDEFLENIYKTSFKELKSSVDTIVKNVNSGIKVPRKLKISDAMTYRHMAVWRKDPANKKRIERLTSLLEKICSDAQRYAETGEGRIRQNLAATDATYPAHMPVPIGKRPWGEQYVDYEPAEYTSADVLNSEGIWADPADHNRIMKQILARESCEGKISLDADSGRPLNTRGRTGISGRGLLGRWGVNNTATVLVTRINPENGMLQMLAGKRMKSGEWGMPGGFVNLEEAAADAVRREFTEEAAAIDPEEKDEQKLVERRSILSELFSRFKMAGRAYGNDPRNTDNAWIEDTVYYTHCSRGFAEKLSGVLRAGDDISEVKWMDIDENNIDFVNLYANHRQVAEKVLEKTRQIREALEPGDSPLNLGADDRKREIILDESLAEQHNTEGIKTAPARYFSTIDSYIAAFLIVVLSLPLALLYLAAYVDLRASPDFTQDRLGYKREKIKIHKIKTMDAKKNSSAMALMLRNTGLDELPQLFNILRGDMAFFGPRPLLEDEAVDAYKRIMDKRRPGIFNIVSFNSGFGASTKRTKEETLKYYEKVSPYYFYEFENDSLVLRLKTLFYSAVKVIGAVFDIQAESRIDAFLKGMPVQIDWEQDEANSFKDKSEIKDGETVPGYLGMNRQLHLQRVLGMLRYFKAANPGHSKLVSILSDISVKSADRMLAMLTGKGIEAELSQWAGIREVTAEYADILGTIWTDRKFSDEISGLYIHSIEVWRTPYAVYGKYAYTLATIDPRPEGENVLVITEQFMKELRNKAPPERKKLLAALAHHEADEWSGLNDPLNPIYTDLGTFVDWYNRQQRLKRQKKEAYDNELSRNSDAFHKYIQYLSERSSRGKQDFVTFGGEFISRAEEQAKLLRFAQQISDKYLKGKKDPENDENLLGFIYDKLLDMNGEIEDLALKRVRLRSLGLPESAEVADKRRQITESLMSLMSGEYSPERFTRYSQAARNIKDIIEGKVITLINGNDEPAAANVIVTIVFNRIDRILNDVKAERRKLFSEMDIPVVKEAGSGYRVAQLRYIRPAGARKVMPVIDKSTHDTLWEALYAMDQMIDGELHEMRLMKKLSMDLGEALELLSGITQRDTARIIEGGDRAKIQAIINNALDSLPSSPRNQTKIDAVKWLRKASDVLASGMHTGTLMSYLDAARINLIDRGNDSKSIVFRLKAGKLKTLRDIGARRNAKIRDQVRYAGSHYRAASAMRSYQIEQRKREQGKAIRSLGIIFNLIGKENHEEPLYSGFRALYQGDHGLVKKIAAMNGSAVEKLLTELNTLVLDAEALESMAAYYRDMVIEEELKALDAMGEVDRDKLIDRTMQVFAGDKKYDRIFNDVNAANSYAIWRAKLKQAVQVPKKVQDPKKSGRRISNPVFEALTVYITILRLDSLETVLEREMILKYFGDETGKGTGETHHVGLFKTYEYIKELSRSDANSLKGRHVLRREDLPRLVECLIDDFRAYYGLDGIGADTVRKILLPENSTGANAASRLLASTTFRDFLIKELAKKLDYALYSREDVEGFMRRVKDFNRLSDAEKEVLATDLTENNLDGLDDIRKRAAEEYAPIAELEQVEAALEGGKDSEAYDKFLDAHRPWHVQHEAWKRSQERRGLEAGLAFIAQSIKVAEASITGIDTQSLSAFSGNIAAAMLEWLRNTKGANAPNADEENIRLMIDRNIFKYLAANIDNLPLNILIKNLANIAAHTAWNATHSAAGQLMITGHGVGAYGQRAAIINELEQIISDNKATPDERVDAVRKLKAEENAGNYRRTDEFRGLIDMHLHTVYSDGRMNPAHIVYSAWQKGVKAVAIADHDTFEGVREGLKAAEALGIKIIPAVELTLEDKATGVEQFDLLAYFPAVANEAEFEAFMNRPDAVKLEKELGTKRDNYAYRKITEFNREFGGFGLWISNEDDARGIKQLNTKDALAAALINKYGIAKLGVSTVDECVDKYFRKKDGRQFEEIMPMPAGTIIPLVRSLGGFAVIAHPGEKDLANKPLFKDDEQISRLIDGYRSGIQGIEAYSSKHTGEMFKRFLSLARKHGLSVTIGSDYHAKTTYGVNMVIGSIKDKDRGNLPKNRRLHAGIYRAIAGKKNPGPSYAVMPENMGLLNKLAAKGNGPLLVAAKIMLREMFYVNFAPRKFIDSHNDKRGKEGAGRVVRAGTTGAFIKIVLSTALLLAAAMISGDTVGSIIDLKLIVLLVVTVIGSRALLGAVTQIYIDIRYIKRSGLQEDIENLGAAALDGNGKMHAVIYIWDENVPKEDLARWKWKNTGLKVDGNTIWATSEPGVMVMFAKGARAEAVLENISSSVMERDNIPADKRSSERLKELLRSVSKEAADGKTVFKPGIIITDELTDNISYSNGSMIVSVDKFKDNKGVYLGRAEISRLCGDLLMIRNAEAGVALPENKFINLDTADNFKKFSAYLGAFTKIGNGQMIARPVVLRELSGEAKMKIAELAARSGVKIYWDISEESDMLLYKAVKEYEAFAGSAQRQTAEGTWRLTGRGMTPDGITARAIEQVSSAQALESALKDNPNEAKILNVSALEYLISEGGERSILEAFAVTEILKSSILKWYGPQVHTPEYEEKVARGWKRERLPALPEAYDQERLKKMLSGDEAPEAIVTEMGIANDPNHPVNLYLFKIEGDLSAVPARQTEIASLKKSFLRSIAAGMLFSLELQKAGMENGLENESYAELLRERILAPKLDEAVELEVSGYVDTIEKRMAEAGNTETALKLLDNEIQGLMARERTAGRPEAEKASRAISGLILRLALAKMSVPRKIEKVNFTPKLIEEIAAAG